MEASQIIPWLAGAAAAWLAWAGLANLALSGGPQRDILYTLGWWGVRAYALVVHRLRITGREHVPASGGLLIVANHTAGVDPILIHAAVPREIRWMMAAEMRLPILEPLWSFVGIISVSGARADSGAVREALRHLRDGGIVGVFPEGGIERPRAVLRPFLAGVGVLAVRARVPVLPIAIRGTPYTPTAWGSLFRPGRAHLRILPPVRYDGWDAGAVVADLECRIASALDLAPAGALTGSARRACGPGTPPAGARAPADPARAP